MDPPPPLAKPPDPQPMEEPVRTATRSRSRRYPPRSPSQSLQKKIGCKIGTCSFLCSDRFVDSDWAISEGAFHSGYGRWVRTVSSIASVPRESCPPPHLLRFGVTMYTVDNFSIDTLSRFAHVRVLRNKFSASIAGAFEDILSESHFSPSNLSTDRYSLKRFLSPDHGLLISFSRGTEFVGAPFQNVLRKHGIAHYYAPPPNKASIWY